MSTSAQTQPIQQQIKKPKTIYDYLSNDTFKNQLQIALPKHLTAERMIRVFSTELKQTPKLANCTLPSLLSAFIQCGQLGLEPIKALQLCFLIPYDKTIQINKKDTKITECQLLVGYRGMINLSRRSGEIINLYAHAVREKDNFDMNLGTNKKLIHKPVFSEDNQKIIGAYAVSHFVKGGLDFEYMPLSKIEEIRKFSRSANSSYSPWNTNYEEMCRKTPIRNLFKRLPVSIEINTAIALDDAADNGESYILDESLLMIDHDEPEPLTKSDVIAQKLNERTIVAPAV